MDANSYKREGPDNFSLYTSERIAAEVFILFYFLKKKHTYACPWEGAMIWIPAHPPAPFSESPSEIMAQPKAQATVCEAASSS